MIASTSPLAQQWSRPGTLDFFVSPDGLELFQITTQKFQARFAIQGAHLANFSTASGPLLFLSQSTYFAPGKAIRGGIPVIFPWFGPREGHPESPMHGLVRSRPWNLSLIDIHEDGTAQVTFQFSDTAETRSVWPFSFDTTLTFTLSSSIDISWTVQNTGSEPFTFEQALHPYFPISSIHNISITGLEGITYIDKTDSMKHKVEGNSPIHFSGETDRLYINTASSCTVHESAPNPSLVFSKSGSASTVVWNPWEAKAKALADLGDNEWLTFVCVEQANANANAITLQGGASHLFTAHYAFA